MVLNFFKLWMVLFTYRCLFLLKNLRGPIGQQVSACLEIAFTHTHLPSQQRLLLTSAQPVMTLKVILAIITCI